MITREIRITVPGHPKPKGSMVCTRTAYHRLRESVDNKAWRAEVLRVARKVEQIAEPDQALIVDVTFTLQRPIAHYGSGRNAGVLKSWALTLHPIGHQSGDVDKHARLILDALQDAGVLHDDSQVAELCARKVFTESHVAADGLMYPGAYIRIRPHEGSH
jgi:Holliday junction resolvase RusA-like endonuclease